MHPVPRPGTIITVPCPLCGADRPEALHASVDRWMEAPGRFRFARCGACGQVYLRDRPRDEDLDLYYPPHYIRRGAAPEVLRRWLRRRDLAPRARLARAQPGRRLLDVGCANGAFLEVMRGHGWVVAGVEPADWAAREAAARGLPVWPTAIGDAPVPGGAFDVATLWDVVEHLPDPRRDLAAVARALRPGGRLLVTTPVLDGWEARLQGERWPGWDAPRHLVLFTTATLERVLGQAGFRVLERTWISESYLISAMYLGLLARERLPRRAADALWTLAHARPLRVLAAPWFRLADRALGGCWLTVVAERSAD